MFRQSARACAGAEARRTTVSWAAVRARGTGLLLPAREDLVARTVPLLFPPIGLASRDAGYELIGPSADCRLLALLAHVINFVMCQYAHSDAEHPLVAILAQLFLMNSRRSL